MFKIGDRVLVYSDDPDAYYGISEGVIVGEPDPGDDEWAVAILRTLRIDRQAAYRMRPLPLGTVKHPELDGVGWVSVAEMTYLDVERARPVTVYVGIDELRGVTQVSAESRSVSVGVAIPQGKRWALALVLVESDVPKRAHLIGWSREKLAADAARAMVRDVLANR